MPSINMIASRRQEKLRFQKFTRTLVFSIVAEFVIAVVLLSFMVLKLVDVRGKVADLNTKIAAIQGRVDEIQKLDDTTAALKPKLATLNEARNNTLYWYTALQTIVASLPDKTWLQNITTQGDPTPPKPAPSQAGSSGQSSAPPPTTSSAGLTFAGLAQTPDQVGEAMLKMNQFKNISNVTLSYVQAGSAQASNAPMSFAMQVSLKANTVADKTAPAFIMSPSTPAILAPATPQTTTPNISNSYSGITPYGSPSLNKPNPTRPTQQAMAMIPNSAGGQTHVN